MILGEIRLFRDGDKPSTTSAGNPTYFRRQHLRVKCDTCGSEWLAIKHSFIKNKCYHANNSENKDYCKRCRIDKQVADGTRSAPKRHMPEFSEFHPSKAKRYDRVKHSNGYARVWTTDLNHPRLRKNARDKTHSGGRVYEHILVVEKSLGRYLEPGEVVHHLDGDKLKNVIDNLFLCKDVRHHNEIHRKMEVFMFDLIRQGRVVFDRDLEEFELVK